MILFDLLCSQGHGFEAWFRDSDSFDRLAAAGEIVCTVCGDATVRKALMAPNISTSKTAKAPALVEGDDDTATESVRDDAKSAAAEPSMAVQDHSAPGPLSGPASVPVPEKVADAMRVLREVQTHIEKNFDHVGKRFAEEARKMHYGEKEKRSIYGEATPEEAADLADEGIDVNRMPWLVNRNS